MTSSLSHPKQYFDYQWLRDMVQAWYLSGGLPTCHACLAAEEPHLRSQIDGRHAKAKAEAADSMTATRRRQRIYKARLPELLEAMRSSGSGIVVKAAGRKRQLAFKISTQTGRRQVGKAYLDMDEEYTYDIVLAEDGFAYTLGGPMIFRGFFVQSPQNAWADHVPGMAEAFEKYGIDLG